MATYHIVIKGQVQGVGFRPFVYKLALDAGLNGWVNNTVDGVHIEINATKTGVIHFVQQIENRLPPLAKIQSISIKAITHKDFKTFEIIHSQANHNAEVSITPDYVMCEACREELFDKHNRRYRYPFITCTNCGPRYSIITNIPYDRPYTTMESFFMCLDCLKEYNNPLDRRYFSQTNSCPECAVHLFSKDDEDRTQKAKYHIEKAIEAIQAGKLIAVKGIGGFLICCDAANAEAIKLLRKRKKRLVKPFALMYPNIELLEKDACLTVKERRALTSNIAPLVLVKKRTNSQSPLCFELIAPQLSYLAVMLPYTPLFALLLHSFAKPLVATSGNVSGTPIAYQNGELLENLAQSVDMVIDNNREIVLPQDDSLLGFTSNYRKKVIYRRSRGMAPAMENPSVPNTYAAMLALGADLKNAIAYWTGKNLFISQYLGNMENYHVQQNAEKFIHHFIEMYKKPPHKIVVDKNPAYFSTQIGLVLKEKYKTDIVKVQHHKAHFAAVLGDNNLWNSNKRVLGVIWDGVGLGNDNAIWGGEFFIYYALKMNRVAHLSYFDYLLGDKMSREPRLSAFSLLKNKPQQKLLKNNFTANEWNFFTKALRVSKTCTSSVGRLFDAVACVLNLASISNFEGHAAMLLEEAATQYKKDVKPYVVTDKLNPSALLLQIINDKERGATTNEMAARFHQTLAYWIRNVAILNKCNTICLSGGVFQNRYLVDAVFECCNETEVNIHRQLSPNDENIAYGQLLLGN